jgi:addiction module HigA family antidote
MGLERRKAAGWAVHPGEVLDEEFLKPLAISQYRLAKEICVPSQAVNDIVRRKRGISADMALRLGRYFATSAEFWLNLQVAYDVHNIAREAKKKIEKIRPHRSAA